MEVSKLREDFLNKLQKEEYISNYLFENIKNTIPDIIPVNFNLDNYNNKVLDKEYIKYKEYFDTMYNDIDPEIHLDEEQIKAILSDEEYSLILAGAGTGKTTTMASKVKFLVDIKKVNPSKILVMSYTKKATQELEKRIVIDFGIPARVTTFHSLGFMYIREIFKEHKCYVVDSNLNNQIFLKFFKEEIFPDKERLKDLINVFTIETVDHNRAFGKYFKENYDKYQTFNEYFESYKQNELQDKIDLHQWIEDGIEMALNKEVIYTIKGELVKSKGEALIANFLFRNNIDYEYEKIYENLMPERRSYHPHLFDNQEQ